jgi:hypothetical protein
MSTHRMLLRGRGEDRRDRVHGPDRGSSSIRARRPSGRQDIADARDEEQGKRTRNQLGLTAPSPVHARRALSAGRLFDPAVSPNRR